MEEEKQDGGLPEEENSDLRETPPQEEGAQTESANAAAEIAAQSPENAEQGSEKAEQGQENAVAETAVASGVCRVCGAANAPDARFCNACGAALSGVKVCPTCGTQNLANAMYCNKCGAKLTGAQGAADVPLEPETENTYESKYTGSALARLFINIGVVLFSVLTLGIAYPFLMCAKEKWIKSHTFVNGRQLEFDGNGAQLIGKFVVWLLLSVVTIGLYAIFRLPLNMQRWKAKHTHVKGYTVDGKKGDSKFVGGILGLWGVRLLRGITFGLGFISFGLLSAWGKLVKLRWFNEKRIIDGVRIHNDAKLGQYWVKRFVWNILIIFTVLIHPIFIRGNSEKKFLAKHDKFANPSVFPRPEELSPANAAGKGGAAAGACGVPATTSTENTSKTMLFIVLGFVIPIPLLFPILANVYASKAKKAGEPNAKNAAIAARVILVLQLIGYIVAGVQIGIMLSQIFTPDTPDNQYSSSDARRLNIGMSQSQVRSYVGSYNSSSGNSQSTTWSYYWGDDILYVTFDENDEVCLIEFLDGGSTAGAMLSSSGTYTNNATESDDNMLTLEYHLEYTDGSWAVGVAEADYDDISVSVSNLSGDSSSWSFTVNWSLTVDNSVISSSYFSGSISRIASMYNYSLAKQVLYLYDRNYARSELGNRSAAVLQRYAELLDSYGLTRSW